MIEIYPNAFNNIGFLSGRLSDDQISPIKKEIDEIQKSWNAPKANSLLAGHLEKQYELSQSKSYIEDLILPLVLEYDKYYNYFQKVDILTKNVPFYLEKPWVNFQKKTEYNPVHSHGGLMSFVLWVKIPYTQEDESKFFPEQKDLKNGCFSFVYNNSIGGLCNHDIKLDSSYENAMVIFPSIMQHCVYPFYSSDEYRISVAGNFRLET